MADPLDDEADSEEERAFLGFVALLFQNESVDRVFRTRVTWADGTEDTAYPTADQLPWIRITPQASGMAKRLTAKTVDQPMTLAVEIAVEGLSARRRMRAWAVFRRAINNLQATFNAELAALRVRDVRVGKAAFGVDDVTENSVIISQGTVELLLNVPG